MGALTFSEHAKLRRKEMHVTEDQVALVISDADQSYPQRRQRRMYQRGDLAVLVNERTGVVITVLWNRRDQWSRDAADDGSEPPTTSKEQT